ncbi:HAD hydrolase family protein [bacterium]|nr:HAD hydrolase family protein [bacterium]
MVDNNRIKKVKMLIIDVDGVLTDGRIVWIDSAEEIKFFNVQDGVGIVLAQRVGLKVAIISARKSKVTEIRAKELRIEDVYQSTESKLVAYEKLIDKYKLADEEVAYIGDDLHDLPVFRRVGFAAAVANAQEEAKQVSHYVTEKNGGEGAVREVVNMILKAKGLWDKAVEKYYT